MTKPDLTYGPAGMFIAFYPETDAGESAWRELAAQSDGTGKFLPMQVNGIISQLRAAGYRVAKATPRKVQDVSAMVDDIDALLASIENGAR